MMAAKQLMNYVERGDIQNSVNFPNIVIGALTAQTRIILLTKVLPETTEHIDAVIKSLKQKVTTSVAKTRNQYGVYAYDINANIEPSFIKKLEEIPGVIRVRILS